MYIVIFPFLYILIVSLTLGYDYLRQHPEKRALDLKSAFLNSKVKMILSAIGGDDTYKLIPFLLNDNEFINAVKNNPKIFMGFSDMTVNHMLLNILGLSTYYGLSFLCDFAELDINMINYTRKCFYDLFISKKSTEIVPSLSWYESRTNYDVEQIGIPRVEHYDGKGFEILNGNGVVTGNYMEDV